MKALSLKQPWADLIVSGVKPVENRKWKSFYRGHLLIHASKTWDKEGAQWICENFPGLKGFVNLRTHLLQGYLIGSVEMVDCVEKYSSRWFFGPYGFVFKKPKFWEHAISYKRQLGIFEVPDSVIPLDNPPQSKGGDE